VGAANVRAISSVDHQSEFDLTKNPTRARQSRAHGGEGRHLSKFHKNFI